MIKYTPANQLTLEGFSTPFDQHLDKDNRWVKLAALIPWDELAGSYAKGLNSDKGKYCIDVRMVIGAIIVKHYLCLDDRGTTAMISENVYLQYFCGLSSFQVAKPFHASLFVDIRKRLGLDSFDEWNQSIIKVCDGLQPAHKRVICSVDKKDVAAKDSSDEKEIVTKDSSDEKEIVAKDSSDEKEIVVKDASDKKDVVAKDTSDKKDVATKDTSDKKDVAAKDTSDKKEIAAKDTSGKEDQSAEVTNNKGILKIDTSIADQKIKYPTDASLLTRCREESERLIDLLYKKSSFEKKPRTYRRIAKGLSLDFLKGKRRKKRTIRRYIKKQLGYLRRNFGYIELLLDDIADGNQFSVMPTGLKVANAYPNKFPLPCRDQKIYWVMQLIYDQQLEMYENNVNRCDDRVVSIYQPYVRPMVRGKAKTNVEFGSKISASESGGMCRIEYLSWDAYNECGILVLQVEKYHQLYGKYPKYVLVDKIYLTRANRAYLKKRHIEHLAKPLGRPPKEQPTAYQKRKAQKIRNQRNLIEGKFGQAKNAYGLKNIAAKRMDTSESWIGAIAFVMNLVSLSKQKNKIDKQKEKKYWIWAYLSCCMQACGAYLLDLRGLQWSAASCLAKY